MSIFPAFATASGTAMVKDINPGGPSGNPQNDTRVQIAGTEYFAAADGSHGVELWKSDGTTAGTTMVKDINPGAGDSSPQELAAVGGTLFFQADDGSDGVELWKSDGTATGTTMVKDIGGPGSSQPQYLVGLAGTLYFKAADSAHGFELWRSDGTADGTTLVKDINLGGGSNPASLTTAGGTLFFQADDGTDGRELWRSDGTADGTALVKNINPGANNGNPVYLADVGGTLYFSADDGTNGMELWRSNGTDGGTTMVKDLRDGSGSVPHDLINVGGTLFFAATDDTVGNELWRSDGTVDGTFPIDIYPGWPGSSQPRGLTSVGGTLYFFADDGTHGYELWRSDGTAGGTSLVKDINPGSGGSFDGSPPGVLGGSLFLNADDGTHGAELWKSDGTADGTTMVADINPGTGTSTPYDLTNVGSVMLFGANDGTHGYELWTSDGTGLQTPSFTVNTTDDHDDGACSIVDCTLREAVNRSNGLASTDTISFDIPGSGVQTIHPTSALPDITDPVVIDGTTQHDFSGAPLIRLDGANAGASANGLDILAGSSTVRGLQVTGWSGGNAGIALLSGDGNVIAGNDIGTDGASALANTYGVAIDSGSSNNQIGGTGAAQRNLISGNGIGISVGSGGSANQVQGNYIGTNTAGDSCVPNTYGVYVFGSASSNLVGGTSAGARNLIACNTSGGSHTGVGVVVTGSGTTANRILGNYVGTNPAGDQCAATEDWGISIRGGASNNTIGGTTTAARNVISCSRFTGDVDISGEGTSANQVQGNYVGTNAMGNQCAGQDDWSVDVAGGASNNTIGGTAAGVRNVIACAGNYGVWINGSGTSANQVQGNYMGTNAAGNALLESGSGVFIKYPAHDNTIGGTAAAARNVISGNFNGGGAGIMISGNSNDVQGNYVGTNAAGNAKLHNYYGVSIFSASNASGGANNTIGGTVAGARNVISGNDGAGVDIAGANANGTKVQGNYIGTNAAGTGRLGNNNGVVVRSQAHDNVIGGTVAGARNVISGNVERGVAILSGAHDNKVQGDYIGTDTTGTNALANNGTSGVLVAWAVGPGGPSPGSGPGSTDNTIGGMTASAANRIAYNAGYGVRVDRKPETGNAIYRNSIFSNHLAPAIALSAGGDLTSNNVGNGNEASPVIGTAKASVASGTVVAPHAPRIEIFANPSCADPEGKAFLGADTTPTKVPNSNTWRWSVSVDASVGQGITATATDTVTSNTSRFSACKKAVP